MKEQTFLVTGGNGFIASWIIKYLLEGGYKVHTTVRNAGNVSKTKHLTDLAEQSKGILTIFEADLLNESGFIPALKDVTTLIHCASPFKIMGIKNAQKELIDPALLGTENVLNAASKTLTVTKIVLTSSVAAIWGDVSEINKTKNGAFTEEYWNNSSSLTNQPYSYSKMLAEKRAWEIHEKQNQWKLVTINPGFVFGPSLSENLDGTSQMFVNDFLKGNYRSGVPALHFGIVDVRDVAQAHVNAAFAEDCEGRHIVCGPVSSMLEVGEVIEKEFPGKYKIPKKTLSKFLFYVVGPFLGFSIQYVKNNIGVLYKVDNAKSKEKLNITYRDLATSLRDQINMILAVKK